MPKTQLLSQKWYECARCGWDWPAKDIVKNKYGQYICIPNCWDENENDERRKATGTGP